jgi:hypothetical protein
VSYYYIYTSPVSNYLLARTILYGVERYIRNVAEDLRDIHDIVKNNGTKLDGLNKKQSEHFKQASDWQGGATTSPRLDHPDRLCSSAERFHCSAAERNGRVDSRLGRIPDVVEHR